MGTILTAKELFDEMLLKNDEATSTEMMIEFAKLHVEAAVKAKIKAMTDSNPKALAAIFGLVKRIMAAKDHIIDQLDSADTDVKATTRGEKGGEGYVALGSKTKLVPRTRWQPN